MADNFNLEAEVRDLCARRDINEALCRYMRGQDRLDAALHLSAFHADAWVDCGLMNGSAAEFVSFAQGFLTDLNGSQHIIGQVQLDINGDTASGEVYFYAWHRLVSRTGKTKTCLWRGAMLMNMPIEMVTGAL